MPELGLSLLVAVSELILIDWMTISLPALGRAIQAFIATFALLIIGLHRIIPWMPAHVAIVSALILAVGAGAAEAMLPGRLNILLKH